jgi:hypothetical protein
MRFERDMRLSDESDQQMLSRSRADELGGEECAWALHESLTTEAAQACVRAATVRPTPPLVCKFLPHPVDAVGEAK